MNLIPEEIIADKIYLIRNQKVMIDSDLAKLYNVDTKRINEQVKRNLNRFPNDFMFQLTEIEWENLMSQNATSSWGGRRKLPYAFTEHGVLMLSSVLKSDRAVEVNIRIMRVFIKLKELLLNHKDILLKVEQIEQKLSGQDDKILEIFNYLKHFIKQKNEKITKIGFK